jgi:RNA polymerase sigma-70 factor (ECF subfamily)
MLGSVAEAEDIVQDAYVRWHEADRPDVVHVRAFLAKVVTRLALDHLKSARVRREQYVGPWLPEPIIVDDAVAPGSANDYAHDLSVTLMLALERLSPLERAAFLLHDVFDFDFAQVAAALGRSEAACRQLAARGRVHVKDARPRFAVSPEQGARIADAFLAAARTGDADGLSRVLAEDAVLQSDGGGKRPAALSPIFGRDKIVRLFVGLAEKSSQYAGYRHRSATINGHPGFIVTEPDGSVHTVAVEIQDGAIAHVYIVRNPEKLTHIPRA